MITDGHDGIPDETMSFKPLAPGALISHYRIINKIGEGGMGVVYKAEDIRLGRIVALKFLPLRQITDPQAKARFQHEARAASALNHPNITTIHEIDEAHGRCFIAMEFVEGCSIRDLIKRGSLSLDEIVDIALQIAEGLDAAHKGGVVHRDIKPDNVLISRDGIAKIMDFGLAKLRGSTRLSSSGTTLGTLHYMSPEQVQGKQIDRRSDIFSFGVMLYEMITGNLPFTGEDTAGVMNSILNASPEPLARYKADIPEGFQRILDKMLSKDREERYQHADEVAADLKRERHSSRYTQSHAPTQTLTPPRSRRRMFRLAAIVGFSVVAVVLYVILQPFRIAMGPDRAAIAQEKSLAVMYFENMVDPEDTDRTAEMITALVITDLSDSKHMHVLSRQRLYDILARLGKADQKIIDRSVASRVAREAGVKWILTGSVLRIEPHIVVVSEISRAETGEILASQRVTGQVDEDLFAVVDRLTSEIRKDMSLPKEAREGDRPVADVTTHSEAAYRYYLEGVTLYDQFYWNEAEAAFRKAVELDSTFAMALYSLSTLSRGEERRRFADKALRYSENASDLERSYIEAYGAFVDGDYDECIRRLECTADRWPDDKMTHFTMALIYTRFLGDYERAIHQCKLTLEIDPLFKRAYNQMAYAYERLGEGDSSLLAINKYISLAPDEANPYDTRGDLYAYAGKLDRAIDSYRKANNLKPGFSTLKTGNMYLFQRRYAEAESCYKLVASGSDKWNRSEARLLLAIVPLYQGKFNEALKVLDQGIAADEMDQTLGRYYAEKYRLTAKIYLELGDYDRAVEEALRSRDVFLKAYPENMLLALHFYVHMLARVGRINEAEEAIKQMETQIDSDILSKSEAYWAVKGSIASAKGRLGEAIKLFEKSLASAPDPVFYVRARLGEAYLEAGRLEQAVTVMSEALSRYDRLRVGTPVWSVKAHYLLGQAYERSGWTDKAIEEYEEFLEIWKNADPGIPEVENARQRLASLRSESS